MLLGQIWLILGTSLEKVRGRHYGQTLTGNGRENIPGGN